MTRFLGPMILFLGYILASNAAIAGSADVDNGSPKFFLGQSNKIYFTWDNRPNYLCIVRKVQGKDGKWNKANHYCGAPLEELGLGGIGNGVGFYEIETKDNQPFSCTITGNSVRK